MFINYVREREAFYDWLTFNHLSPTAQSLWNALFTICNAKGWPDGYVKVPDILIRSYMHVSNDALLDARNQLKNKGLLDFIKGDRRASAAAYKLHFFTVQADVCPEKAGKEADKEAAKEADKGTGKCAGNPAAKAADTYKLNTNVNLTVNLNECEDEAGEGEELRSYARECAREDAVIKDVMQSIKRHCGRNATPAESAKLVRVGGVLEMPFSLLDRAVQQAAQHGARDPVSYAITLLNDWDYWEIRTPEELDRHQALKNMFDGRASFGAGDIEYYREMEEERKKRRIAHGKVYLDKDDGKEGVREWLDTEALDALPAELRAVIVPVRRRSRNYNGAVFICEDRLFVPSESEVFGSAIWSDHECGTRYEGFDTSERRIRYDDDGEPCPWWCLSSSAGSAASFTGVDGYGAPGSNSAADSWIGAPLCFCL